jgi:hypothetical protein
MSFFAPSMGNRQNKPIVISSSNETFSTGSVPTGFLERLYALFKKPYRIAFGLSHCTICDHVGDMNAVLVAGADGQLYTVDSIVQHYIGVHHYCPPTAFIEAVQTTPLWQDEPIALTEETLFSSEESRYGCLPARYFALRYKDARILEDPRWTEAYADTLVKELVEAAAFGMLKQAQMSKLLIDSQYNLPGVDHEAITADVRGFAYL